MARWLIHVRQRYHDRALRHEGLRAPMKWTSPHQRLDCHIAYVHSLCKRVKTRTVQQKPKCKKAFEQVLPFKKLPPKLCGSGKDPMRFSFFVHCRVAIEHANIQRRKATGHCESKACQNQITLVRMPAIGHWECRSVVPDCVSLRLAVKNVPEEAARA